MYIDYNINKLFIYFFETNISKYLLQWLNFDELDNHLFHLLRYRTMKHSFNSQSYCCTCFWIFSIIIIGQFFYCFKSNYSFSIEIIFNPKMWVINSEPDMLLILILQFQLLQKFPNWKIKNTNYIWKCSDT
jgi:hypothetical protein